jgi:hypothetical protein
MINSPEVNLGALRLYSEVAHKNIFILISKIH